MELAMVIPIIKMWFVSDYWEEGKSNKDIFAEYNLLEKCFIWKQWNREEKIKQGKTISRILSLAPFASPFMVVPFISILGGYTSKKVYPIDRLQNMYIVIPVLLGIIIFLTFEYYMLYRRQNSKVIDVPQPSDQKKYFENLYTHSIKNNEAVGNYKTPYLVTIVSFIFLTFVVVPLMFWLYNQSDTLGNFILKLVVLSSLISLVLNIIWNGFFKAYIMKIEINKLKKELEN